MEDTLWHKMVSSFKDTSTALCNTVALLTQRLLREYVDPKALEALLVNRGVALDKDPGIRPIGIGEMLRRIIGKAVLEVFGADVEKAVGPLQLCAGQSAGVEAGVHAMRSLFESKSVEGALFIDAENAFNKVNRAAGLHNIHFLCPPLRKILTNFTAPKQPRKETPSQWLCTPFRLPLLPKSPKV